MRIPVATRISAISRRSPYWLGIFLLLAACNTRQEESSQSPVSFRVEGETILIPDSSNLKQRIKVQEVQSQSYRPQLITAGRVQAIPNQYAQIAPPFPGRVVQSFVRLGQKMQPGSPLFSLSSADFMEAQKAYLQSRQQLKLAEQNRQRQQDLLDNGVGVRKDLEEAETTYQVQKGEYENARASLRIYNVEPDQLVLGQPLVVRSPIRGEVIENNLVVGQYLKDDSEPVAVVAQMDKVWVAGQVKEKDIRFIHELDEVEVKVAALPDLTIKGQVYHVKDVVDEATRSVEVLVQCDNPERDLKPGMYVTVRFSDTPTQAILVPAKALLQQDDHSFVFVETSPGRYQRRPVAAAAADSSQAMIQQGLKPGERIISEGGFYLLEAR